MFITTLITGFIISSITIGLIFLIKKLFPKQLSAKWQYNLWYLLLFALIIPFIPGRFIPAGNLFHTFTGSSSADGNSAAINSAASGSGGTNSNWMQDFSVTVTQTNTELLNGIAAGIWIAGALVFTGLSIHAWLNLRSIKKSISHVEDKEILDLFQISKQQLNISKNIVLGVSDKVRSPLTFGLRKTFVVLPANFEEWLSRDDIKHILLHELNHYKYKDIPINYLMVFFQIIYWFNPFVWIAFKEMRLDREIACDHAVLTSLDDNSYKKYGNTIIHFIDKSPSPSYNKLANQLNGSKKQIKKRIIEIASFQADSKLQHAKSIGIFLLAGLFVVTQIPLASAMANDNSRYTTFNHEQTSEEDLSAYFKNYEGSFVLYDMQKDAYHIYNKDQSTLRVSPDSTYKIYSALFGLEENVITPEQNRIEWDGVEQPYEQWNGDQNLETALNRSVNWYFQQIDQEIGLDNVQSYLNQIHYGNQDTSGGLEQYWLESSLKISPVEQVELLHSFYNNSFDFQEEHIEAVKNALQMDENDGSALYGKTGTGNVNGKDINGWFIGFVETETNTYFFATNIQDEDNASGSIATEITLAILKDKQIIDE
ncbi:MULTISPECIES: BlaR1 family beta-lactam sensor/signal transducer [Oceanobacillus]|uniref:BlaR1 family beta-lactam sensor/signal transducer n=1 Tax=Oceanobacillus neutriphilus TaxID=531815 RepID=A0ABQ2NVY4_9BACI|nr:MULTISPECIES: BlaR1 family beta-lactam sensor/signal transducer [Oceanobacillus]GGP11967.1 BlaR1 family beta-lactam sensor/signal transducer [Oceanobacillus neutriphilus]